MTDYKRLKSWRWIDYNEVASTNDEAQKIGNDKSFTDRYVITARCQTAGRGRRGRQWVGLDGNLFMSLLLRWPSRDNGALVLISGIALLQAILQLDGQAEVKLKWPNDVLLQAQKVSGILLEAVGEDIMVVGIGVNITACPLAENMLFPPISLQRAGIITDRETLLSLYLEKFDDLLELFGHSGMDKIVDLWQKYAYGIGQKIKVNMPRKTEEGIFVGLDENGILQLQTTGGDIKKIAVGDVFFDE